MPTHAIHKFPGFCRSPNWRSSTVLNKYFQTFKYIAPHTNIPPPISLSVKQFAVHCPLFGVVCDGRFLAVVDRLGLFLVRDHVVDNVFQGEFGGIVDALAQFR